MKSDRLTISQLTFDALIGVHAHEQRVPQQITVDLELIMDLSRPAASDQLADALDYVSVADHLARHIAQSRFRLIEALADSCARQLLTHFPVESVHIIVRKPGALPGRAVVAVDIWR